MAACKVCWQGWLKLLRPSTTLSLGDEGLAEIEASGADPKPKLLGDSPKHSAAKLLLQRDPCIAGVRKGADVVRRGAEGQPVVAAGPQAVPTVAWLTPAPTAAGPPSGFPAGIAWPPTNTGSAQHGMGQCNPCAWFWKPTSCMNDKDCVFCHMCPAGELKNRKKAKAQARRSSSGLAPASPAGVQAAASLTRSATTPSAAAGDQPGSMRVLSLAQLL